MASSMWDTLLGGDSPYPLRVGDKCFSQTAKGADVDVHDVAGSLECCKQCRNQADFHGVKVADFPTVLDKVDAARDSTTILQANPNGLAPEVLKYFQDIPTAGVEAQARVEHMLKYVTMFATLPASEKDALEAAVAPKSGSSSTGGGGASGGASGSLGGGDTVNEVVKVALADFLAKVIEKVPALATPQQKYDMALKRKGTWLDANGAPEHYDYSAGKSEPGAQATAGTNCGSQLTRMNELQDNLIEQLKKLQAEASSDEVDSLCGLACSEDVEMNRMQMMYKKLHEDAKQRSSVSSATCELTSFTDDETIKQLNGKLEQLKSQSFAFLHAECEAVEQCKPHVNVIPEQLIDCSGLYESEILFNDTHMAAIGQYLAGAQRDGRSPGALGHASRLYVSGTIAPGVNPEELWLNVCYRVPGVEDGKEGAIDTMWVRANVCDQRKYETLRAIRKAITEQKRAILALNREILDLQFQVSSGHGFTGPAAFFSTARREGVVDDGLRTQMAIKSSVARAASSMRRNSDRRRKPQLLSTEEYDDGGDDGAQDPRFARMMRTLAGKVRGAR